MLLRSSGRIVATDTHELTMENTAGSCWGAVSVRESIISDIRPVWLDFFFPPLVIGRSGSNYCGVFAQWASREMQEATGGSRADDDGWEKFVTSKDQSTRVHMTLMVTQHVNIQGLFFFSIEALKWKTSRKMFLALQSSGILKSKTNAPCPIR